MNQPRYEYRLRYGHEARNLTPWGDRPVTAEELAEWQEDFASAAAERRLVTVTYGEPEKYTP